MFGKTGTSYGWWNAVEDVKQETVCIMWISQAHKKHHKEDTNVLLLPYHEPKESSYAKVWSNADDRQSPQTWRKHEPKHQQLLATLGHLKVGSPWPLVVAMPSSFPLPLHEQILAEWTCFLEWTDYSQEQGHPKPQSLLVQYWEVQRLRCW